MTGTIHNVSIFKSSITVLGHPNKRVIGGVVGMSSLLNLTNCTVYVNISQRHLGNGNIIGQALGGIVG